MDGFCRGYEGGREAEQSARSEDAVEGAGVSLRERGVPFAQYLTEAGRGCGVSGTGRGEFPDHRAGNLFQQEHWEEFAGIFGQVVKLAREMNSIRMGTLAIDGTKVRANASNSEPGILTRNSESGTSET